MRLKLILTGALFSTASLFGQAAHPRIFFDTAYKSRLAAKVAANDADWRAFKTRADFYLTKTFAPYVKGACSQSTQICWTGGVTGAFEGDEWAYAAVYLGVAYQLTGNTAYSDKAKEMLYVMRGSWDGRTDCATYNTSDTNTIPPLVDSGYGWRNFGPALGWAYDWIHQTLTTDDKIALTATAACFFDASAAKLNQSVWANGSSTDNYPLGYLKGVASMAYAMEGDTDATTTWLAYTDGRWANIYSPAFSSGAWSGGYPAEAYGSYGFGGGRNLLQYLWMRRSAKGQDLFSDIPLKFVTAMAHSLQPSRWRTTNEVAGSMPNGVLWGELPTFVAHVAEGTTAGAYAQYLYNNLTTSPSGYNPKSLGAWIGDSAIWNFLYKDTSRTATDYTATFPTYYDEGVDQIWVRSDWTTSAHWSQFTYGTGQHAGHQQQSYGQVKIARGSDFLLAHDAFWGGLYGDTTTSAYEGSYGTIARSNSLYFDDRGAYLPTTGYYVGGGQPASVNSEGFRVGIWADIPQLKAKKLTSTYAYAKSELTSGYDGTQYTQNAANRTLRHWFRTFAWLGDGFYVVFDRILSKAATPAYDKRLFWHLPPNTSPTSWTSPTITGNRVTSATVGSSKLVLNTVLPASAVTTFAYDPHTVVNTKADVFSGDVGNRQTMRVEVTDNADAFDPLTVIMALGSGDTVPEHGSITNIDANHLGAYILAESPRIAVFSADGNARATTWFTLPVSGTAKILVADLAPGTYTVSQDGVVIVPNGVVSSGDGTLFFNASCSGCVGLIEVKASYAIQQSSLPGGAVGVPYSAVLATIGGVGLSMYTVTSGSLPAGLSISSGGEITGIPEGGGASSFTVTATDTGNASQTTQATLTITVAWPALTIGTTTLAVGSTYVPYVQALSATGGDGLYRWALIAGVLPRGLTVASETVAGMPVSAGVFDFTLACSSGDGQTVTRNYRSTITLSPPTVGITGVGVSGITVR